MDYFRTSSFYPAAFLFARGKELVGIESANSQRSEFVFADPLGCERLVQDYNFAKEDADEVAVDARKLAAAIRLLKEKLYQEKARQ